ncbi:DUF2069 domain-containing protein [Wenzhouxiangella sp. AB-CW3]|uniref:DUF2069 domain-containing protein n=1 Tax=Wenzhouxiangella sp. AB-CW3 TaxID=2771012 RepID=UPI00168A9031|nr:DUF2069 domain-containing protein [Wenzhouxiangella sp. AB-CW3]QOC22987.1 DUF2069 domain-containing protein [Wenzhouxiangella sp. AB-CW3]
MMALWWCRVALVGLIVIQPLWFGWIDPPEVIAPIAAVIITTLPLLLVAPGVWRLNPRSLVIAGVLLLFYFCLAVMEAWVSPASRAPAIAQLLLIGVYFTALPAVRRRRRHSD